MNVPYPVPVGIYALLALTLLLGARQGRALKAVLVASYCGVLVTSFTGGASGGVWIAELCLFLFAPVVVFGVAAPGLRSTWVARLTYAVLAVFAVGVVVGLARYDPNVEILKAGAFTTVAGIPTRVLMAGYRTMTLFGLFLAFALPLRYRVDRNLLISCLTLSWLFSLVLAALATVDYLGIADMAFSYRREAGYRYVAILGFHRASLGLMLLVGIFLSFMLTQISRGFWLKAVVYASAPALVLGLLFTWSRAANLALGIGALSLVFTLGASRALKALVLTIAGALVVWVILLQFPDLQARFSLPGPRSFDEAAAGRLSSWADLIVWLGHRPDVLLFGAGFQNFHYYVGLSSGAVKLEAAHNAFLHILSEAGIFGFCIFLMWIGSVFLWLRSWRRTTPDPGSRTIAGAFTSLMLAIVVTCFTQESLLPIFSMFPFVLHFYIILGIFISYYRTEMADCSRSYSNADDRNTYGSRGEWT